MCAYQRLVVEWLTTVTQSQLTNLPLACHFITVADVVDSVVMTDTPTPTTTATATLDDELLAAIDDQAADQHMTDPEAIRELALGFVDRVEVVTEAGEPVGTVLARDEK